MLFNYISQMIPFEPKSTVLNSDVELADLLSIDSKDFKIAREAANKRAAHSAYIANRAIEKMMSN